MTVYHHGSILRLEFIRKGSYVVEDMLDALCFAVPWGTEDLDEEKTVWGKNGRPPTKLVFKDGREPEDCPIFIYSIDGAKVKQALTNTGAFYDWNRQLLEDCRWGLRSDFASWKRLLMA